MPSSLVLLTAARNEAALIRHCLDAVTAQTQPPRRWVIVDDASTDGTGQIVAEYAKRYHFLHLVRRERTGMRNFGSKAEAISVAADAARDIASDFIAALDADSSFEPDFFERLMERFAADERLGLASGTTYEFQNGELVPVRNHSENVGGQIQVFRRACYEEIGGYVKGIPGNIDSVAVYTARMRGWRTWTFDDLPVYHHRRMGTGEGHILSARFKSGYRDHIMGYHPLYHLAMSAGRLNEPPYLIGSVLRVAGFAWGALRTFRQSRPLPKEFVKYLRKEQMGRLRRVLIGNG